MTTLIFLLAFLAFAVAGLALGLWQLALARRRGRREALPEHVPAASEGNYGPMTRLFEVQDLQFLRCQRGYQRGMAARLRLQRRAVLSLYLRQVHADFRQRWAYCRAIAPFSESPEAVLAAVRHLVVFYGLYTALQLHCLLGLLVYVRTDVGSLLAVLQRVQQRARQAVARTTNWPAVSAR
jgi:hypothetical protein